MPRTKNPMSVETGKTKPRRICEKCGGTYVPTSNNQKFCPLCRDAMARGGTIKDSFVRYAKACQPGEVKSYNMNDQVEDPKLPDVIEDETPWEPDPEEKENQAPAQMSYELMAQLAGEVLAKYAKGDLIEKPEPVSPLSIIEQISLIKDRICSEICKYAEEIEKSDSYDHCCSCPLQDL